MDRLFLLVRAGLVAFFALLFAGFGRWIVLRMSGDGQAALLISAFLLVVGGFLGYELSLRFAPLLTDRLARLLNRNRRG